MTETPPPADTPPPFPSLEQIATVWHIASSDPQTVEERAACEAVRAHLATLAAAQATAQRLAKFEDDELHKSVVRDLPGHPVYAPCALEGCQYDDVATVAQGTARHLSELEDIRRCLRLCPAHELTPMWEDGKSTCLICEYCQAQVAYAALREAAQALVDANQLPVECPHGEEPDYCDGCRYAVEKAVAKASAALRAGLQGTGPTP